MRPAPGDESMNPALRAEVQGLRESMAVAANAVALPARFDSEPHGNQATFTDRQTGRSVTVGLCDYHGARKVLAALYPDGKTAEDLAGALAEATPEQIVAALRTLDDTRFDAIRDAIREWDRLDYEGTEYPLGTDDDSDELDDVAAYVRNETCIQCGGKIRDYRCRDCDASYEEYRPTTTTGEQA